MNIPNVGYHPITQSPKVMPEPDITHVALVKCTHIMDLIMRVTQLCVLTDGLIPECHPPVDVSFLCVDNRVFRPVFLILSTHLQSQNAARGSSSSPGNSASSGAASGRPRSGASGSSQSTGDPTPEQRSATLQRIVAAAGHSRISADMQRQLAAALASRLGSHSSGEGSSATEHSLASAPPGAAPRRPVSAAASQLPRHAAEQRQQTGTGADTDAEGDDQFFDAAEDVSGDEGFGPYQRTPARHSHLPAGLSIRSAAAFPPFSDALEDSGSPDSIASAAYHSTWGSPAFSTGTGSLRASPQGLQTLGAHRSHSPVRAARGLTFPPPAAAAAFSAASFRIPEGLDLDDLIRLGEEIVPMTHGDANAGGSKEDNRLSLDTISPMHLAAYLASKVRPAYSPSNPHHAESPLDSKISRVSHWCRCR